MAYQITNCEKSHSVQFHDMDLLDGVECYVYAKHLCALKTGLVRQKGFEEMERNGMEWNGRENGRKYKTTPISHSVVLVRRNAENVFYTLTWRKGKKMCMKEPK